MTALWDVSARVAAAFQNPLCALCVHLHGRWIGGSTHQMECVRRDYWFVYACFQSICKNLVWLLSSVGLTHPVQCLTISGTIVSLKVLSWTWGVKSAPEVEGPHQGPPFLAWPLPSFITTTSMCAGTQTFLFLSLFSVLLSFLQQALIIYWIPTTVQSSRGSELNKYIFLCFSVSYTMDRCGFS